MKLELVWREPSRVLHDETARWRKRWSRASQVDKTTVQAPVQPWEQLSFVPRRPAAATGSTYMSLTLCLPISPATFLMKTDRVSQGLALKVSASTPGCTGVKPVACRTGMWSFTIDVEKELGGVHPVSLKDFPRLVTITRNAPSHSLPNCTV